MSHGEDRKGQLGLGVARVIAVVIVALLEEGVVRGLRRERAPLRPELPSPWAQVPEVTGRWAWLVSRLPRGRVAPDPYKGHRSLSQWLFGQQRAV